MAVTGIFPLTPLDSDLQDFAFMPLHVARLRDSDMTGEESAEACWYGLLLWAAAWHQLPAGSLPDSDGVMTKLIGLGKDVKTFRKHKAGAMRHFVLCSDGRWYHPIVAEVVRDAWRGKLVQRWKTECARIKKRNQRDKTDDPQPSFEAFHAALPETSRLADVPIMSPICPQGHDGDGPGPSLVRPPISTLQGTGTGTGTGINTEASASVVEAKKVRSSRICPASWLPSPEDLDVGLAGGMSVERIERELAKFRDHQFQTPKSAWSNTFRNWLRKASESITHERDNGSSARFLAPDARRTNTETRRNSWFDPSAERDGETPSGYGNGDRGGDVGPGLRADQIINASSVEGGNSGRDREPSFALPHVATQRS